MSAPFSTSLWRCVAIDVKLRCIHGSSVYVFIGELPQRPVAGDFIGVKDDGIVFQVVCVLLQLGEGRLTVNLKPSEHIDHERLTKEGWKLQ